MPYWNDSKIDGVSKNFQNDDILDINNYSCGTMYSSSNNCSYIVKSYGHNYSRIIYDSIPLSIILILMIILAIVIIVLIVIIVVVGVILVVSFGSCNDTDLVLIVISIIFM